MLTKFEVERRQVGEVEIDLELVNSTESIKDAIKEAQEEGLVKWRDVSPMKIINISMSMESYMAKCIDSDNETYNLLVLAEDKSSAIELIEEYMAGISESYKIKLSKANKEDLIEYIDDPSNMNFEQVIDISEGMNTLDDYENEY